MKEYLRVANTMLTQMRAVGGIFGVGSWGVEQWIAKPARAGLRGGSLEFIVNGLKFSGLVTIDLNFMDLYNVTFTKDGVVVHTIDDVYADELFNVVDTYVET